MPVIILADNGSTRASATLQLRKLASSLGNRVQQQVHAVSFQHANKIPLQEIDNKPADIFYDFMKLQLSKSERDFILLPLFFGNSKALSSFVPENVKLLQDKFGPFKLRVANVIYPLPYGEKLLSDIIVDHVINTAQQHQLPLNNLVLVDHGSPVPRVTEVRRHLAHSAQQKLPGKTILEQAVMERRAGKEYDFNGELLQNWLLAKARAGEKSAVVVLLFFLAGRHAGAGGDIAEICQSVNEKYPGFKIAISPLISEHKNLISILQTRLKDLSLADRLPCRGCTINCTNYNNCEGKPWRMSEDRS
ncbi:MAG: cobalamin biosynthesis protein CbiX [Gammaproteobacteria bacterium]|nr:cobalamin biosynthesis protein CbiX [Gammaproteobacteria bacterium]